MGHEQSVRTGGKWTGVYLVLRHDDIRVNVKIPNHATIQAPCKKILLIPTTTNTADAPSCTQPGTTAAVACWVLAWIREPTTTTTDGPRAAADRKLGRRERQREGAGEQLHEKPNHPFLFPSFLLLSLSSVSRHKSARLPRRHRRATPLLGSG